MEKMKNGLFIFALSLFTAGIILSCSSSQEATNSGEAGNKIAAVEGGPNAKDSNLYLLRLKYPLNIYHIFKFVDSTKVKRTFRDETVVEFIRVNTFYFTQKLVTLEDAEYQEMEFTIDSMKYRYIDENGDFSANSESEVFYEQKTGDLAFQAMPINKEFSFVFSPYGEVATVKAPKLHKEVNDIISNKDQMGSEQRWLSWVQGLSDERMISIANVKKLILPPDRVRGDSIWYAPFHVQVSGKNYYDTVATYIENQKLGDITLSGNIENMVCHDGKGIYNGIKQPVTIESTEGKGKFTMFFSIRGLFRSAVGEYYIKQNLKANKEKFTEETYSRQEYTLIERYKY